MMASIRKRGQTYQAQIRVKGIRESKTFFTLSEARDWSFLREMEIKNGRKWTSGTKKLSFLLDEYAKNVTPNKKTAENELNRIQRIQRTWLVDLKISDIEAQHIERWILGGSAKRVAERGRNTVQAAILPQWLSCWFHSVHLRCQPGRRRY
jgi:hypothetical protein